MRMNLLFLNLQIHIWIWSRKMHVHETSLLPPKTIIIRFKRRNTMTDLELDVWDAWLRGTPTSGKKCLANISPSRRSCCRYYLLTGYIQGVLEALTMLTTVEDGGNASKSNLIDNFARKLLLSGRPTMLYSRGYKPLAKTAVLKTSETARSGRLFLCPRLLSLHTVSSVSM